MLKRIIKSSFLVIILLSKQLHGSVFYVDCGSQNASDYNTGTFESPWKTIQFAVNNVAAGDTVLIRKGIYKESIYTKNNGDSIEGFIVFSAYPGEKVVIDGSGVTLGTTGFSILNDYVKLQDIEIENWNTGIWIGGAAYTEISNCTVHDAAFGIGAGDGAHDFTLNSVIIYNFDFYGFDASPSGGADCYNGILNDCVAHTGRDPAQNVDGFALGHGTQHSFVFNRCTTYNVFDGFDISSRSTLLNSCLAYNCWNGGYKLWQDDVKLVNCISFDCNVSNVELDWDGQPGASTLLNCTFSGAKVFSVWVENSSDTLKMHNCIISGGDNIGLAFEQAGNLNYSGDYNLFHCNNPSRAVSVGYTDEFSITQIQNGVWANYSKQDANSLAASAQSVIFTNPFNEDFHLFQNSLAVDKGTSYNAPDYDYESLPRPSGAGWDIGAYEYQFPAGIRDIETVKSNSDILHNFQNYPNPFNSETIINYSLLKAKDVTIAVYSIEGQIIKKITTGIQPPGNHSFVWDGTDQSGKLSGNGLFLIVINYGRNIVVRKITLLK